MKTFSFLEDPHTVHLQTHQKVLPKEEFSTLVSAQEVLQKAQEEAHNIIERTKEECEILKHKAQEEGFQQGLCAFNDHLLSLNEEAQKLQHEMQKMILPLALKAAQKIVKKEIEMFPNTIVDIVMQVITSAKNNKRITIFANKKDVDALETNKPKIKQLLDQVQVLSVQEKDDISPGGCIIETESGIINASIENQWLALELAFDRYQR